MNHKQQLCQKFRTCLHNPWTVLQPFPFGVSLKMVQHIRMKD
uniref:Uncharacterized protein n=1 Tax=Arundo donax TaxID=35708 RepID=A0A0A9F4T9_ARUDO